MARHNQQLEIECELLDCKEWEGVEQHLPTEELESGLRVTNIEVEQQPNHDLIHPALKAAKTWVGHLGVRVTLRADDCVAFAPFHEIDEDCDVGRVKLHVRV